MMKAKCYFAHSESKRFSKRKMLIANELHDRGLLVIDPFIRQEQVLAKHKIMEYRGNEKWKLARELWTKDLGLIDKCDILVGWVPEKTSIGVSAEITHAYMIGKYIQIISPILHPSFSVYADQLFLSIGDFIRRKDFIKEWRKK